MNLPVIHEISTTFSSIGFLLCGESKKAGDVWNNYAKKSIIGSTTCSVVSLVEGK